MYIMNGWGLTLVVASGWCSDSRWSFLSPNMRIVYYISVRWETCPMVFLCTMVAPLGEFSSAEVCSQGHTLPILFSLWHPRSKACLAMLVRLFRTEAVPFKDWHLDRVAFKGPFLLCRVFHDCFYLGCIMDFLCLVGILDPSLAYGQLPAFISQGVFFLDLLVLHRDLQRSTE